MAAFHGPAPDGKAPRGHGESPYGHRGQDKGFSWRMLLLVCGIGLACLFAARWAYAEYWVSQHCTLILGTRVCQ
ncbi:MAG TPA: hypothetical protein VKV38_04360 [Trebonia sp.]|jgi:hypothetical protein|nr:hypothetical protein [Trebonia sp.]